ncbi:sugar MFS transporter [Sodaliphilus sp.]|uniref:sugar MFS transporter n=1 Tax=Sodaliphilus sp. TaxID=2815818 RepID=UPI00388FB031
MKQTLEKQYILPFILVTSLFLLWGLANNMTDTLLAAFKRIMDMSDTQTSLIQFAFYGSYFCFALPAALFIRKKSFKAGIILGLLLYSAGAILFYPAAKVASYAFYLVAIYIMAGGCSVLETTANPYILSMGSQETATRRLNIAQSFNPIGSILGILMSKYFILDNISLYSVSATYATLGCVLIGILVIMLCAKMPLGKDTDKQDGLNVTFKRLFSNSLYRNGVVAQFFYVGAQIGVWSFTIRIVMQELGVLESEASTIYLITIIGFCLSRFVYTWLMKWVSPAKLLVAGGALSALMALIVAVSSGTGWFLITALVLISVFMSLMFPTIYGIALSSIAKSNHPEDSKIGASGLIMAILGGAILTPLQGMVSDVASVYISYLVPVVCFAVVMLYAISANKKRNQYE